jgi:HSP20 family protein
MKQTPQTCTAETCDCTMQTIAPDVAIFETPAAYVVEAELPGVPKENLRVTLEGAELTVTGRRTATGAAGDALLRERVEGDYRRTFTLADSIDAGRIAAEMREGVLTLTLPKSERAKPQSIEVAG